MAGGDTNPSVLVPHKVSIAAPENSAPLDAPPVLWRRKSPCISEEQVWNGFLIKQFTGLVGI